MNCSNGFYDDGHILDVFNIYFLSIFSPAQFCLHGHRLWKWNSQPTFKYGMQAGDFMLAINIMISGNNYALLFKLMNMGSFGS